MKKIISLILFLVSIGIFYWYMSYTKQWPFDYHLAQFVEYLLYWSVTLFVISLFALTLNRTKYKIWLLITLIYLLFSVLIAYQVGDGSGILIVFDGKLLTWIFAGLYSFVSIVYFIVQFFKNKKKSTPV